MPEKSCDHVRSSSTHELLLVGDSALMVYADEHRIEQVLVNLVNNAVKYAPGSYRIFLNFQTDGEMVKINIRDTGPGIPSEKIPHLFDRYYRADNSGKAGFWAWFGSLYQRGDRQAAWRANWG